MPSPERGLHAATERKDLSRRLLSPDRRMPSAGDSRESTGRWPSSDRSTRAARESDELLRQLASKEKELSELRASSGELEITLAGLGHRIGERTAMHQVELRRYHEDFECLRHQAQQANMQLRGAYEAVTLLEDSLVQERRARR